MKQQFEVGDKAIWKGGEKYKNGVEVTVLKVDPHSMANMHYKIELHDGFTKWAFDQQLSELPTTPTTIVTVHGNPDWKPDWKPEKELSHYELLKELPGYPVGEILDIKHGLVLDYYHADSYPDFFAPVYKEAKPIEFTHRAFRGDMEPKILKPLSKEASDFASIHVVIGGEGKFDTFICTDSAGNNTIYFGHFNSGNI